MSRKFIAAIVAGSIAITGFSTTQASAGDRDLTRFLVGATALVIIGKALSDDQNRRYGTVQQTVPPRYQDRHAHRRDQYRDNHNRRDEGHRSRNHNPNPGHDYRDRTRATPKPRPLPERVRRGRLPGQCMHTYKTNQGRISMYSKNCLDRTTPRLVSALPRACKQRLWGHKGPIYGYSPTCLTRKGWLNRR